MMVPPSGVDTTLSSNQTSGQDVASGTHLDGDSGLVALSDGLTYAWAKGVLDTGDSHKGHVARELFVGISSAEWK